MNFKIDTYPGIMFNNRLILKWTYGEYKQVSLSSAYIELDKFKLNQYHNPFETQKEINIDNVDDIFKKYQ